KYANVLLLLRDDRDQTSTEIVDELRKDFVQITGAIVRISEPTGGPPVGKPITIKFKGDNIGDLTEVVNQAERVLAEIPGVTQIENSFTTDGLAFALDIDRDVLSKTGLTPTGLAFALRTAV